jgi:hypothetical protein
MAARCDVAEVLLGTDSIRATETAAASSWGRIGGSASFETRFSEWNVPSGSDPDASFQNS